MGARDSVNVAATMNFNVFSALVDINTIIVFNKAKVGERRIRFVRELKFLGKNIKNFFSHVFTVTTKCKVINLAEKENNLAFVDGFIDATIMYSRAKTKLLGGKDGVDISFVDSTTFWVTLEATKNRKNMGAVDGTTKCLGILVIPPFSICIINLEVCRYIRGRAMCESIFNVSTKALVIKDGREGKE